MSESRDELEADDLLDELDSLRGLLDTGPDDEPEADFSLSALDDEADDDHLGMAGEDLAPTSVPAPGATGDADDELVDLDALIESGWAEAEEDHGDAEHTAVADEMDDLPDEADEGRATAIYAEDEDADWLDEFGDEAGTDSIEPTADPDDDIPILDEVVIPPAAAEEQYGFEEMASEDWAPADSADPAPASPLDATEPASPAGPPEVQPLNLEALVEQRLERRLDALRDELRQQLLAELRQALADK